MRAQSLAGRTMVMYVHANIRHNGIVA